MLLERNKIDRHLMRNDRKIEIPHFREQCASSAHMRQTKAVREATVGHRLTR